MPPALTIRSWAEEQRLGGAVPNPRLALVCEGIRLCREQGVGSILAVGGGSVIDSAKAIGIGVPYQCDVWDFFTTYKGQVKDTLPVGVVLTIPAAGSEASNGCVITCVMERYFTNVPAVDFTDRLCEATLQTIICHVPTAL